MKRFPDSAGREESLIALKASSTHLVFVYTAYTSPVSLKLMLRTSNEKW
jgi:hypothetical protein